MLPALSTAYSAYAAFERVRRDYCPLAFVFFFSNGDVCNSVSVQAWELTFYDGNTSALTVSGSGITFPQPNRLLVVLSDAQKLLLSRSEYSYTLYNLTNQRTEVVGSFAWQKGRPATQGVLTPPDLKVIYSLVSGDVSIGGLIITGKDGPAWLTPKGNWQANTAYATGDGVIYDGSTYRRKAGGNSGSAFNASQWDVVAQAATMPNKSVTKEKLEDVLAQLIGFLSTNALPGYAFGIEDGTGKVAVGVDSTGRLVAAALTALSATIATLQAQKITSTTTTLDLTPADSILKVVDSLGGISFLMDLAGNIQSAGKLTVKDLSVLGTLALANLTVNKALIGTNALTDNLGGDTVLELSDQAGGLALRIRRDGTLYVPAIQTDTIQARKIKIDGLDDTVYLQTAFHELNHVIGLGQSNSVWETQDNSASTAPALMFTPAGVNTYNQSGVSKRTAFVQATRRYEPAQSAAVMLHQLLASENPDLTRGNYKVFLSSPGMGGTPIETMLTQVGNTSSFVYQDVQQALALAIAQGWSYAVKAVTWTQGEAEANDGNSTRQAYAGKLAQVQQLLDAQVKVLTGQKETVFLISYQVATQQYAYKGLSSFASALGQLDLAATSPVMFLACPSYMLPFSADGQHFTDDGHRVLGAYYGLVYKRVVVEGKKWKHLKIRSTRVANGSIYLTFDVPVKPLVLDTTLVSDPGKYGFQLFQADGTTEIALSSVSLFQSDTLKIIATSAVPAGAILRYGFKWTGTNVQAGPTAGPRGCLRDSAGNSLTFDPTGLNWPMHNWLPIQDFQL